MSLTSLDLRPGDWVRVRSIEEIRASLDSEDCLDSVPFMAEMSAFCGRRMKVLRRVEKVCHDVRHMQMREFIHNDVVFLEDAFCSGDAHGGCQKACRIFWKERWLERAEAASHDVTQQPPTLTSATRSASAPGTDRYFCQSTQLEKATVLLSKGRRLVKCLRDVQVGTWGWLEMARWIVVPLGWKLRRKLQGEWPRGTLTRTPEETLNLEPGEWVEVKSLPEIVATLDAHGKNRGLHFSCDMARFCGGRFRVRNRIDRMISEETGGMFPMRNTVILEGITCECPFTLGGCPRALFQYWREIWLRRAPGPVTGASAEPRS